MTTSATIHPPRGIEIPAGTVSLKGDLAIPSPFIGLVIFAHGSGSSRLSPRNQWVAERLQQHGLGTLLFDLLTEAESASRAKVFDISLLAGRLAAATAWVAKQPEVARRPIGYFGASTGAGAALVAAASSPHPIAAVVSRGGRPDLAGSALARVTSPTLLIVGSADEPVIGLNRLALEQLAGPRRLAIVPGATHLFEEPGTLEEVAQLAEGWFLKHMGSGPR